MSGTEASGTFTVSIDTELAWGTFDTAEGYAKYERAYRNARQVVDRLCAAFDTYEIPVTWAVVAHLVDDCDRTHAHAPKIDLGWCDDWYASLPCQTGLDPDLWYAPDVVEPIQSAAVDHEIGLHGYSHLILGADNCTPEAASSELSAAVDTLRANGIDPTSFVFPRNRVAHLEVLREHGLTAYRGLDDRWYEHSLPERAKKPFRFLDEALARTPAVVTPREVDGLVEVPGSQVFRPFHDGWQYTRPDSQRRRAIRGLERAASTGKLFHLRFHPFDLGFEPDRLLELLEAILRRAHELVEDGDLVVRPMRAVEQAYRSENYPAVES